MMWNIIILLLVPCITALVLLIRFIQYRINLKAKIKNIPGPMEHRILGSMLKLLGTPEYMWNHLRELATKYYPIYKMWYFHYYNINLINPEDIEIVLSSTKHSTKSDIYIPLHPWLGTGLLTSSGTKWQQRRKILTPSFHFSILQQFIEVFAEHGKLLVQDFNKECNKPYTNIVPLITQSTLSAVCETAMGIKLNKEDTTSQNYAKAVLEMGEISFYRITRVWFLYSIPFMFSKMYKKQKALLKILHNFSRTVIKNRSNVSEEIRKTPVTDFSMPTRKRRLAMLDLLISVRDLQKSIDDEGIREEVDTFTFEGHDTTSACISFTLLLLANHKEVQEMVFQELQDVFGDSDRHPTLHDLQSLTYLERVLKESLRLYPSVPFISRITDEEIHTHTGYIIPANTVVLIHIYDLHQRPELYPDPEKFDPDRFLPENSKNRHPFAYIPFSAGPRNCIGQKFAFLEIKTIISFILRNFVLEAVDKPSDVILIADIVMRARNGIKIKFVKRK